MAVDRYGVMGNPIAHSKSPQIHCMFAEQTGQRLSYEAILVPTSGFAQAVSDFFSADGKGLNITVPFKQEACQLSDSLSTRAAAAQAVNTLLRNDDGTLFGDNTDGVGLVRDLSSNLAIDLCEKRILLLGAGGAARGVITPILEQQPTELVIANRTAQRAEQLARQFTDKGPLVGCGFDALRGMAFDLIINATAAGLTNQVPQIPDGIIRRESICYDMVYSLEPTAFMRYALRHGAARAYDGLGMLVEQAAASFSLWRGVTPDTAPVIAALRSQ